MICLGVSSLPNGRASARPFSWQRGLREIAMLVPGVRWNRTERAWFGYADGIETFAQNAAAARLVQVGGSLRVDETPCDSRFLDGLRGYQQEGVRFLVAHAPAGALLADDTGVGKSAQALRAVVAAGVRRAVIVCPAVVKSVWQEESAKWLPDACITLLRGTKPDGELQCLQRLPLSIVVLNYDIAHAWVELIAEWKPDAAVFDEAHMLMGRRSRRTTACREIARRVPLRIALRATPLTARPRDLWAIVETVSPGRLGSYWPFAKRYADAHREAVTKDRIAWVDGGASNVEELAARLRHFMLRRTKSEVMAELPARIRQVVSCDVRRPFILPVNRIEKKDALAEALARAGSGKVPQAASLAMTRLGEGHSVVLFSHLRDTAADVADTISKLAAAEKMDVRVQVATGALNAADRMAIIHECRTSRKSVALSVTIDAVGTGIDLTFASVGIFVDLDWVPSKLLQAEGRLHRANQQNRVVFYYLVARGTADEYIRARVLERLHLFERVLGATRETSAMHDDLAGMDTASEEDVLAGLKHAVARGQVMPAGEWCMDREEDREEDST